MEITIDPKSKWITTDFSGHTHAHTEKPAICGDIFWKSNGDKCMANIFANDLGPWRESLHQIIDNKLVKYVDIPAKDEPVLVGECDYRRYSAGYVDSNGHLMCYTEGATSWSGGRKRLSSWRSWRRPTTEELEDRA